MEKRGEISVPSLEEMGLKCVEKQWDTNQLIDCTLCVLYAIYQKAFYYYNKDKLVSIAEVIRMAKQISERWRPITFKWYDRSTATYVWNALTILLKESGEIVNMLPEKEVEESIYIQIKELWKVQFWAQLHENKSAILEYLNYRWIEYDVDRMLCVKKEESSFSYLHRYYDGKAILIANSIDILPFNICDLMLKLYQSYVIQILIPKEHEQMFEWIMKDYPAENPVIIKKDIEKRRKEVIEIIETERKEKKRKKKEEERQRKEEQDDSSE